MPRCHFVFFPSLLLNKGWSKSGNTQECISPISYRGPCPRFLQMEKETKKKKFQELQCNISWSYACTCTDVQRRRRQELSPARDLRRLKKKNEKRAYHISGKAATRQIPQCSATVHIKIVLCTSLCLTTGSCLLPHDFSNMTNDQKEIWGNKCAVSWPCKVKCVHLQMGISNHVPPVPRPSIVTHVNQSKWPLYDATCSAPKFYSGPCLSRASLLSLDKDMKPCPKDWIVKSDASGIPLSCLPPDYYSGPYTLNVINYEEFCPENWIESESVKWKRKTKCMHADIVYYCVAPQDYMGPCSRKKRFEIFSREIKIAYADECNG
ncbi:CPW-WPC family protein [Plasmodium ovale wallikeri]|uniref:CPW-WPC family protein n=1 Tax=Plasmodium ovale wallikeri TaxID=864142 RepID=A0A1A8ZMP1_PLAOA|nr:CPW-WPC family protein [Plasmodium ovale wallikeri]SBT45689.1 CPW-WPC family protein [Plasmodium ovale wallikeri]